MTGKETVTVNSSVVLREEFDDWAILFDPDTNICLGINPVGVYIWRRLEEGLAITEIISSLKRDCNDVPPDVAGHVRDFIDSLISRGLAEKSARRV